RGHGAWPRHCTGHREEPRRERRRGERPRGGERLHGPLARRGRAVGQAPGGGRCGGAGVKRVLIVDDNREMAATLAEHLGEHGYEASVESSGSAALVRAKREPFDAV